MAQRFAGRDDFEATIRILREDEGGRRTPTRNGVRWDFCYADDNPNDALWMIHPDFLNQHGESCPEEENLRVGVLLLAKMFIVVDEMRAQIHRHRLKPGVRFYCHEGSKRVAEGIVTKITHLFDERLK